MRYLKRTISVIAALLLIVSALAACAPSANPAQASAQPAQQSAAPAEATQAPADQATQAPQGPSAKDQIYAIIAKDPLGLNGIPERSLENRTSIAKALPQTQRGNLTIGYTSPFMGSAFFTSLADRMQALCDEYGYKLIVQNANVNIQTQIAQVEAFITQKVDVIILNGLDLPSCVPVMKKAVDAGIPVLSTGGRAGLPEYQNVTCIVSNSFEAGWMTGCYTAQKLFKQGETLKTGFVIIELGAADSESRSCGFLSGYLFIGRQLAGNPYPSQWEAVLDGYNAWKKFASEGKLDLSAEAGLNLIALGQSHSPDANGGQKASADMITGHPDIDLIFSENDSMYAGIEVNLKQNNLVPGQDVKAVCPADGVKIGMVGVNDGRILAVGNNSSMMIAEGMIKLIHKIFEENYDANNLPGTIYTPTDAICKENFDTYCDLNEELAKGIPYDFYTIDEYNAQAKDETDPFPVPSY